MNKSVEDNIVGGEQTALRGVYTPSQWLTSMSALVEMNIEHCNWFVSELAREGDHTLTPHVHPPNGREAPGKNEGNRRMLFDSFMLPSNFS